MLQAEAEVVENDERVQKVEGEPLLVLHYADDVSCMPREILAVPLAYFFCQFIKVSFELLLVVDGLL